MQRSILNKNPLTNLIYLLLFVMYESLSSIYLFLPPLLAVLFILFTKAIKEKDTVPLFFIGFLLLIFEADKGYIAFSSIIYFTLVYKIIIPKLKKSFSCSSCLKISYVLLAYIGFYIFSLFLSTIFLIPIPEFNYYIIYYIVIEFFIVSLL